MLSINVPGAIPSLVQPDSESARAHSSHGRALSHCRTGVSRAGWSCMAIRIPLTPGRATSVRADARGSFRPVHQWERTRASPNWPSHPGCGSPSLPPTSRSRLEEACRGWQSAGDICRPWIGFRVQGQGGRQLRAYKQQPEAELPEGSRHSSQTSTLESSVAPPSLDGETDAPTSPLPFPSPTTGTAEPDGQAGLDMSAGSPPPPPPGENKGSRQAVTGEGAPPEALPRLPNYRYSNKFIWLMGLRMRLRKKIEGRFQSELLRRVVVTVVLLLMSRAGHFVPVPGFDRSLMQAAKAGKGVMGMAEADLIAFDHELPLNLFSLGIGPFMFASTLVSVFTQLKLVERWKRLREEGKAGQEVLQRDIWRISAAMAICLGFGSAVGNSRFAIYAQTNPLQYYFWTPVWLASGAMIYHWISERITEDGFGQGTSVLISVSILMGCAKSMGSMLLGLQNYSLEAASRLVGAWLGCFLLMTSFAAGLLGAKTDVELEYFDVNFQEGLSAVEQDAEVRPYAPFSLAPQGVTPVFYAHYFCLLPRLLQSMGLGLPFDFSPTAGSVGQWVYYAAYAFAIVALNWMDLNDTPGQLSTYLVKIGARVRGTGNSRPPTTSRDTGESRGTVARTAPGEQSNQDLWTSVREGVWRSFLRTWRRVGNGWALIWSVLLRMIGIDLRKMEEVEARLPKRGNPPRPGEETREYLRDTQDSTRFIGGLLLAVLSISSNVFDTFLHHHFKGSTIGFTSMLIIVGSIISMRRTYEAYQQMPELERIIAKYKFNLSPDL